MARMFEEPKEVEGVLRHRPGVGHMAKVLGEYFALVWMVS